jgi:hypothetical protein
VSTRPTANHDEIAGDPLSIVEHDSLSHDQRLHPTGENLVLSRSSTPVDFARSTMSQRRECFPHSPAFSSRTHLDRVRDPKPENCFHSFRRVHALNLVSALF